MKTNTTQRKGKARWYSGSIGGKLYQWWTISADEYDATVERMARAISEKSLTHPWKPKSPLANILRTEARICLRSIGIAAPR